MSKIALKWFTHKGKALHARHRAYESFGVNYPAAQNIEKYQIEDDEPIITPAYLVVEYCYRNNRTQGRYFLFCSVLCTADYSTYAKLWKSVVQRSGPPSQPGKVNENQQIKYNSNQSILS